MLMLLITSSEIQPRQVKQTDTNFVKLTIYGIEGGMGSRPVHSNEVKKKKLNLLPDKFELNWKTEVKEQDS